FEQALIDIEDGEELEGGRIAVEAGAASCQYVGGRLQIMALRQDQGLQVLTRQRALGDLENRVHVGLRAIELVALEKKRSASGSGHQADRVGGDCLVEIIQRGHGVLSDAAQLAFDRQSVR